MIHPATELRLVNPQVGYGVFASRFIPMGSLVYVQDPLEIHLSPERYASLDEASRQVAEKYSFIEPGGNRVLSWDSAKYVNHSCRPNTMSTAWGFEIAVADIEPGEEITDEYGLFNLEWEMDCCCGHEACRGRIRAADVHLHFRHWDKRVRHAVRRLGEVDQPLLPFVDAPTRRAIEGLVAGRTRYRSVRQLILPPAFFGTSAVA
ncbi:SET domain-containing protein [Haloferula sargassicola]|uniref:Post-SET domain-containing protein n=1 Tax=Haloferula sargassicola TaxID=490096 RepID=A0ABP9USU2_9BACT